MSDPGGPEPSRKQEPGLFPDCIDTAYRSSRSGLLRYFRRHVADRDEAHDLVQEAFLKLMTARPPGGIRDPNAFLQRIARNILFNRRRHLARWRRLLSNVPLDEIEVSAAPEQDQWIEAGQVMDQYRRALAALPARTRTIFLLHRVDELTYLQIADRLGVSAKTVEYHMASALKHLSRSLDWE